MYAHEYFKDFLRRENFTYDDSERHYALRYQGTNFIAFKNEGPYLQICVICNTEGQQRSRLLEVCNSMNQRRFVLKFTVSDDNASVWGSYEFCPDEHTTSDDFLALLRILDTATNEFFEQLNEN